MGTNLSQNEQNFDYIWIDSNINNYENYGYSKYLLNISSKTAFFLKVDDAINFFLKIKFRIAFIIVSGSLFPEFINKLKRKIGEISAVPKIIIFTSEQTKFKIESMNLINDSFYNKGGIALNFTEVLSFLNINFIKQEVNLIRSRRREKMETGAEFSFELLDIKSNLIGILYYTRFFNEPNAKICQRFDEYLMYNYGDEMKELIQQIYNINCPISLRIKYWLRAYTLETKFYKDMNSDLMKDNIKPYIPYIQLLYSGLKLNDYNYSYTDDLYRGTLIKIKEINKILTYMKNKNKSDFPAAVIYSKAFMSFSLDKNIALKFMQEKQPVENKTVRVLYILKKDLSNIGAGNINRNIKNSTNADLTKISYFEDEKEVLLFPFSVYEISAVNRKDNYFIIELNILSKYKENIKMKFKKKSELIFNINRSSYIEMLQNNGILPIIRDFSSIVVHFLTEHQSQISLFLRTSDMVSSVIKILHDNCAGLKGKDIILLCNGISLDKSKSLEENGVRDDDCVLVYIIVYD